MNTCSVRSKRHDQYQSAIVRQTIKLNPSYHCFIGRTLKNIWSLILYLEAGETELINTCVVPFAIAEFGQKCLEAASTLKYEPLNSCITVHSVWIMKIFNVILPNTFSRNKRRKNCEESRWRSQSVLVWPLAMSWLDAKISLVPKHQLMVPLTLLAHATLIPTDKATKPQSHKATRIHTLRPMTYELFFQNRSIKL